MADHQFDLNFSLVFSISRLFACTVLQKIYLSQLIWLSVMSIYYLELFRILGGLLLLCFFEHAFIFPKFFLILYLLLSCF